MNKGRIREYGIAWGVFLVIGFVFVLLYSTSTSFLMPDYNGIDSALYCSFGRFWSEGLVPYVDYYDHKGPLIFWINMVGYKTSITVVQSIFMSFSLLGFYSITSLFTNKYLWKYLNAFLCLYFVAISYDNGNMSEEYCLPFLSFAIYFLVKHFRRKMCDEHDPRAAFIYGLSCAVCLMTRTTNVAIVGSGILVILIGLVIKKNWKNIIKNALCFLVGFLLIVGPFSIYFMLKNGFTEYLYGTFLGNIMYYTTSVPWILNPTITFETIRNFLIHFSPLFLGFLLLPLTWKNKPYFFFILIEEVVQLYIFLTGFDFYHYAVTTVPLVAILISELIEQNGKTKYVVMLVTLLCLAYIGRMTVIGLIMSPIEKHREYAQITIKDYQELTELVDGTFITYGDTDIEDVYIRNPRLKPYYRYVFVQDWMCSLNSELAKNIHDTFANGDVEYILTDSNKEGITDILTKRYEIVASKTLYTLYKIK